LILGVRLPRLCIFAACACVAGLLRAASFDDRIEALFRPLLAEMITLSPDGQRVAYTSRSGSDLAVVIQNFEHAVPKRTIKVELDRGAATGEVAPPVQLRFLRWATATRLVFAPTERIVPLPPVTDQNGRTVPNPDGPTIISPILVADADGKQRGILIDAPHFQETPADARRSLADLLRTTKELQATRSEAVRWRMPHLDVLGFLPSDREQLIIQTRGAYSIPAQYLIDIRTGSVREFGGDWPLPPGEPQVFDPYRLKVVGERKVAARPTTAWSDEELGRVQRDLEAKFPRRNVEILDWNETRTRVLFRVTGGSDPGRFFVFQRPEDLPLEILRRAPWLTAAKLNETRFFEFKGRDGAQLSGYLTWPAKPRLTPPPLLVSFPSGFPGHAQPAFDPESQVFADLGFVVARLNHRSVAGVRSEDLNALREAADRVSVDDARAAVERIAALNPQRPFDQKHVATLGRGYGGYLAVRALQLEPAVFRCGIAIDAPMELREWLRPQDPNPAVKNARDVPAALIEHAGTDWKKVSVVDQAETLTNPVLLLVEPGRRAEIDRSTATLRARLQGFGRAPDYLELDSGFAAGTPGSRASVYRKIGDFLNLHLHGFAETMGPTEEVK
jgi:dipeptidyl aminopeptidase/acylaminoacyl peptidase